MDPPEPVPSVADHRVLGELSDEARRPRHAIASVDPDGLFVAHHSGR
jgi:hypothetical protein